MTLLDAQLLLVRRCGKFMKHTSMNTDASGDNDDMADPILWALRVLGYTPASVVIADDADLAPLLPLHLDPFLDLAELRLLQNIRGNMTKVSTSLSRDVGVVESWGQLLTQITGMISAQTDKVENMHGSLLVFPLSGGGKRYAVLQAI